MAVVIQPTNVCGVSVESPATVQALDAVEAFNALNPELLNYQGRLSDDFLAVDVSNDALDGCFPITDGCIDTEYACPERWDETVLFHSGLEGAGAAVKAMKQINGVKRILAIDRREFLRLFPCMRQAGCVNGLDWRLPSAMWAAPTSQSGLGLFLASRRAVECKEAMRGLEITAVLDLSTRGGNVAGVEQQDYLRIEILDDDAEAPKFVARLPEMLTFVATQLRSGSRVVVHCDKGQSRSGSVVVAWLMVANNWSFDKALAEARRHRSCVRPNDGFAAALRGLDTQTLQTLKEDCGL